VGIALRSGYRVPAVNQFGNERGSSCASNANDRACHIRDRPDERGAHGAIGTVAVPGLSITEPTNGM
jgi:hypothetical protein